MILIHQLSSGSEGKYNELDDILKDDLWLDSNTCKKYGLVDEII